MRCFCMLLAGLSIASASPGAEPPKLPTSLVVPVTAYAQAVTEGEVVFLKLKFVATVDKIATTTVTKYKTQKQVRDGVEFEVNVPVTETVQTIYKAIGGWREVKLDPSERGVMVTTAAGKLIPRFDLPKLLKEETPVLVSAGRAADPFYLLTVKDNTLVIIAPESVVSPSVPAVPRVPNAPAPNAPMVMPPRAPADAPMAGAPGVFEITPMEKELCELANAERKKAGLPALATSALLFKAARQHSANMAKQGVLSHTLDEKDVADRLKAVGYEWSQFGENIALGAKTPADAILTWMNSPPHKENLLTKESTQFGVAVAATADGQQYWTMVFGAPK
jgi:uncharacterized protein YkwD